MVKTVTTKKQKLLESFKTKKPFNKIMLRFSKKQSIDFCLTAKEKAKLFQIILKFTNCQTTF